MAKWKTKKASKLTKKSKLANQNTYSISKPPKRSILSSKDPEYLFFFLSVRG
jgi:hypothetical protein